MRATRILTILLAVQLALVAIAWWPRDPSASRARPVFDHPRDAIDEISIAVRPPNGEEEDPVVLARTDDGWVVRSAADYPATAARVEALLDAVLALRAGAPIATRPSSHEALSVAEDNFGRRLSIVTDGESSDWLVGPATRRSLHLRRVGEDEVYEATGAGEGALQGRDAAYWDALYLDEDPAGFEAAAIHNAHGDLRFEKQDDAWTLADLVEGETAGSDKIGEFLAAVARVRMSEPVGTDVEVAYGLDGGTRIDWTIVSDDQSVLGGYGVGSDSGSDAYLKAVDRPFVVRVSQSRVQRLRDAERSQFLE